LCGGVAEKAGETEVATTQANAYNCGMKAQPPLTISQAAAEFGVTRQRMWQLFGDYNVALIDLHPRCKLVTRKELRKIPRDRRPGPKK
jgi:hypothetical protein